MWFLLLPAWLGFNLLAYFVAPVLPLFAKESFGACDNNNAMRTEPRLPDWLSWFQTPDNSLNGDGTFERLNPPCYWSRVTWLWRNPAYGFERSILAANVSAFRPDDIKVRGDVTIHDKEGGKVGFCFVRIGPFWNLVWIKRIYGVRCLYCNFGWNLKTYAERPARMQEEPTAQYVCSPRFSRIS